MKFLKSYQFILKQVNWILSHHHLLVGNFTFQFIEEADSYT